MHYSMETSAVCRLGSKRFPKGEVTRFRFQEELVVHFSWHLDQPLPHIRIACRVQSIITYSFIVFEVRCFPKALQIAVAPIRNRRLLPGPQEDRPPLSTMDSKESKREKAREVVDILEEISELLVSSRNLLKNT